MREAKSDDGAIIATQLKLWRAGLFFRHLAARFELRLDNCAQACQDRATNLFI